MGAAKFVDVLCLEFKE